MDIVSVTISLWVRVTMSTALLRLTGWVTIAVVRLSVRVTIAVVRLTVRVTAVVQAARISLHPTLALKHIS